MSHSTLTPETASGTSFMDKLMPSHYNRWVKGITYGVVIANIMLIVTGGLVRLTGSGLGCSTWPRCNGDQWTTTPEQGIHGAIEFGNRLLTFGLLAVTILSFLAIVRIVLGRKITFWQTCTLLFGSQLKAFKGLRFAEFKHADLFNLNLILLWGIIAQAIVGGVTVWLRLNPWMVTAHYVLTAIMIAVAAVLLNRLLRSFEPSFREDEGITSAEPPHGSVWMVRLGWVGVVLVSALVFLGTVVTGTGPHAGDPETHRHAFDPVFVTRNHSLTVWLYCATLVALFVLTKKYNWPKAFNFSLLLVFFTLIFQAAVGYAQYFTGLPVLLVELHLIGSGLFIWAASALIERQFTLGSQKKRSRALERAEN